MRSSPGLDNGGDRGSGYLRDGDAEDHFDPSLFAECPLSPVQWPEDAHAAILAANLLLLYLNLARLSSMSTINDARPLPVTVNDRDDRNNNDDNR